MFMFAFLGMFGSISWKVWAALAAIILICVGVMAFKHDIYASAMNACRAQVATEVDASQAATIAQLQAELATRDAAIAGLNAKNAQLQVSFESVTARVTHVVPADDAVAAPVLRSTIDQLRQMRQSHAQ